MSGQKQFTDLRTAKERDHVIEFKDNSKGCYCNRLNIFLLILLFIAACVIVGLAMYYAHPDYGNDDGDSREHSGENPRTNPPTNPPTDPPSTMGPVPTRSGGIRLPPHLEPYHYNVRLRLDIYNKQPEDFTSKGSVEMYLHVKQSTNEIIAHVKELEVDYRSIRVSYVSDGSDIPVNYNAVREEPIRFEFLVIPTMVNIRAGESIKVRVEFQGPLKKDLKGIYYSNYLDDQGETVYLLTSQLQPTDSRKVFPCLDEPALKTSFNVTIERRSSLTSKSNMEIIRTDDVGGGWLADVYHTTPVMSTYLLAFLVSDFRCRQRRTASDILVEICARPTAYEQTEFASSIAVEMQEWFEQYHNVSYPLNKMTHTAVPDFSAGAMENWGLVLYRETALLYDPMTSSTSNKQRVAVVVSHELAHMWFGDLVTPEWWDDIWLNEGFASYMELLGIDNVHDFDTWEMEEQFVVEDLQSVMVEDSLVTSHPIYTPVNDPAEIGGLFDRITYSKGASVIRMMKYFLGEETFRWGLSNYLKDNLYGITRHQDLFGFLAQQSSADGNPMDVQGIMNTWIKQMGYPVIDVTVDKENSRLQVKQKHFILDPIQDVTTVSDYNYIWKVPISYTTDVSPPVDLDQLDITWLNDEQGNIALGGNEVNSMSWAIANVGQTFYYRVNYDIENWNALISQLRTEHGAISTTNRAQIIDDLFNLGRAGEVAQGLALVATDYINKERSYTPWYALSRNLAYMRRMLGKGEGNALLQSYMQNKVQGLVDELGYEDRDSDAHLQLRLRSLILSMACTYELDDCLSNAAHIYQQWMAGNTTEINVNFASTIFCSGIAEGGLAEWDYAYQRFLTSNSGTERASLMSALGCTKQQWILQRYLGWALDENNHGIARQDMRTVINSVSINPVGTHLAWSFFKANWPTFHERFGDVAFTLSSIVSVLTRTFSTDWELSDLQEFINRNPDQGTAQREFQKSLESTHGNMRWRRDNEEIIIGLLNVIVEGTTPDGPGDIDVRLPPHLVPYHYNVHLRLDIYDKEPEEFMSTGSVDIHLRVAESTNKIITHFRNQQIYHNSITVKYVADNSPIPVNYGGIREEPFPLEFLVIPTTAEIMAGEDIVVHIEFQTSIQKDLKGIYYSDYINDEGEKVYLLASHLQPTEARKVFPCLDEPALKATFDTTLERRDSLTTKSNMDIIRTDPLEDGWLADVYDRTPIMSTYLLVFLVSDFQCRERHTSSGVLVEICARPTAYEQTVFANDIAVEMQEWFEQYHNVSYPLNKMTHAAVPDFASGAMENWGLVLYRETALLYDPMTSSTANKQRVAVVVSHELAHMWFGDLVTPEWWDDIWLNEGFASYMETRGIHNVHDFNTWEMDEQFVVEDLQSVMVEDSLVTSHPIYVAVNDPAEIKGLFDRITYSKGASVIRMMKYFLGEETFRWGLSNYLKDTQFGSTKHADLFRFLTEQSRMDGNPMEVQEIMNTWIYQMGYPVIEITVDKDTKELITKQKHFILDPSQEVTTLSEYNYIWKVPISYTTDVSPTPNIDEIDITWLNEAEGTVPLGNEADSLSWVIGNVGQTFYYRVNYDIENWNALINQLKTQHQAIGISNRAQIIDDLFNLGRAGEVNQALALSAIDYINNERSYTPWYALARNIAHVRRMMGKGEGHDLLQTFMQDKVRGVVEELGYEDRPGDGHLELRLRALILSLACTYELDGCLSNAAQIYKEWMTDNTTEINVNFASVIFCNGIAEGGLIEWDYAYQRFLTSNSGAERASLMSALACSKQPWILQRYLEWALDENHGIGRQDFRTVISYVSINPLGTHIAWSFFKANWHVFLERFGSVSFTLPAIVSVLTRTFSTEWELADLQNFIDLNPEQLTAQREFQKSLESTIGNIRWRSDNEEDIVDWLKSKMDGTMPDETDDVDVRLPMNLEPYHYNIRLRLDFYNKEPENFLSTGSVSMYLRVIESTNSIVAHIKNLAVDYDSITVNYVSDGTNIPVKYVREMPYPLEFLVISTTTDIMADREIVVHIEFQGPITNDLVGIYYTDYVNESGETVYLLASQLQPTDGRKVFPCLDEPGLKTTFNVTLERQMTHTTKSNMEILSTNSLSDGWQEDVYHTTPIMSTYLLAFLVSDFRCRQRTTDSNVLVEICARPTAYDQTEFANSIALEMQDWFAEYHDIGYPLNKITHVALPDFVAGAMENWGLVMYRETALLYDPLKSSAANKQRVALVVAHELAHMWFGDLVTPTWWDDLWLNEGFASYMMLLGMHNVHDFNTWSMEEQFVVLYMQDVMVEDSLVTSHPVYQPVNDPAEIGELFDAVTYDKGASVIRMMKYFLGEDTFRWGIANYLKDNLYGSTSHSDLFQFLSQQAEDDGKSVDVEAIMNTWIRQMGYPVIEITVDKSSAELQLKQKHFILDPTQEVTTPSEYNYTWKVPISYTTDVSADVNLDELNIHWLDDAEGTVELGNEADTLSWVIANVGQTFYYRVNYDGDNWNALIDQLRTDHEQIHSTNRAQIIDDLFNLAGAGEVAQVLALSATQYMNSERSYIPWYALSRNIAYMGRMLSKGTGRPLLQSYMQDKVKGAVEELGYADREDDQHLDLRLRSLILGLACSYQLDVCLSNASKVYQDLMADSTTPISVNFANVIYCNGISEGGLVEWEFAYNLFLESNSGSEKATLLRAMACTKQTWILQRYLEWALDESHGIARQDMGRVLAYVSINPLGTHIAWSFFKANWHIFFERFGAFSISSMVNVLTRTFSTEWELEDLQNFIERNPDQGAAQREFQKSLESTRANIRWREQNEDNIISWLQSEML